MMTLILFIFGLYAVLSVLNLIQAWRRSHE